MILSFDTDVAKDVGADAATIFHNILFWIRKNQANGVHFHDGHYWTYNSMNAFEKLFPHLSFKVVRTSLAKLERSEYVITGNFNKNKYDKTKWYALGRKGLNYINPKNLTICPNGQINMPTTANQYDREGKPIPDSKPYINTDKDMSGTPDLVARVISYLNRKANVDYKPNTQATIRLIHAREKEGFKPEDFKTVIDNMCREWKNDPKMKKYLRPSTLFAASKFEGYLNMGRRVAITSQKEELTEEEKELKKQQMIEELEKRARASQEAQRKQQEEAERLRQERINSPEYKEISRKIEEAKRRLVGGA